MKKAFTSLFGLIPTSDIDINGANEFMKGVFTGIVGDENLKKIIDRTEESSNFQFVKDQLNEDNILYGVQMTNKIIQSLD